MLTFLNRYKLESINYKNQTQIYEVKDLKMIPEKRHTGNLKRSRVEKGITWISKGQNATVAMPAQDGLRLAGGSALQHGDTVDRQCLVLRSLVDDRRWTRVDICHIHATIIRQNVNF